MAATKARIPDQRDLEPEMILSLGDPNQGEVDGHCHDEDTQRANRDWRGLEASNQRP